MTRPSDKAFVIEQERDARVREVLLAQEEITRINRTIVLAQQRRVELNQFIRHSTDLMSAQTALANWYRGKPE
jgi:hypothetical protein